MSRSMRLEDVKNLMKLTCPDYLGAEIDAAKNMAQLSDIGSDHKVKFFVSGRSNEAANVDKSGTFRLVLVDVGANKIGVIKAVRQITALGLREAKDIADDVSGSYMLGPQYKGSGKPRVVLAGSFERIQTANKLLAEAGARTEIVRIAEVQTVTTETETAKAEASALSDVAAGYDV